MRRLQATPTRAIVPRGPTLRGPAMRALGPASVSSLLKIVLDVVQVALWLAGAVVAVAAVVMLLVLPFKTGALHGDVTLDGRPANLPDLLRRGPRAALVLAGVELYVAALIVIVGRLRRVFETLIQGDPFRPDNVGRLRQVGAALVALEGLGWATHLAIAWLFPHAARPGAAPLNLTAWFSILVVFVLAEVFREGARLRRDAELTI